MRAVLRRDLGAAIKSRDRVTVAVLRSALAAIDNAETPDVDDRSTGTGHEHVAGSAVSLGAAEVERRELSDDDVRAVLVAEIDERMQAAAQYRQSGRDDAAERLQAEADVLRRYVPTDRG